MSGISIKNETRESIMNFLEEEIAKENDEFI